MVETVNNLLQPQALNAWRDLTTSDQLRAATMLLDTVEESAFVLADNLLKTDIVRENTDNIRKWLLLYRRAREGQEKTITLFSRRGKRKKCHLWWTTYYEWYFISGEISYCLFYPWIGKIPWKW